MSTSGGSSLNFFFFWQGGGMAPWQALCASL